MWREGEERAEKRIEQKAANEEEEFEQKIAKGAKGRGKEEDLTTEIAKQNTKDAKGKFIRQRRMVC